MTKNKSPPQQSSMFDAFDQADFERTTAHLPDTIEDSVPLLRAIIERYNACVIAGDQKGKEMALKEAEQLADKLNGGTHFGKKVEDGICDQLAAATAAPEGTVPIWGQSGDFTLGVRGCKVRVEFDGIYGLCELGFSTHAVEWEKPFISETGYRSFLLGAMNCEGGGESVEAVVRHLIESYLDREQKGKLVPIDTGCRDRNAQREEPQP